MTAMLTVTSSTGVMAVGFGRGGEVVAEVSIEAERRHAEEIGPLIQQVLSEASATMNDLEALVVDVGPGRFTGLRVGLATVRALAFSLDVPVVGLTSLEILAAASAAEPTVTAVIDARRGEVFQQTFVAGVARGEARVGKADDLAAEAEGLVVGDGYDRYPEPYDQRAGEAHNPTTGSTTAARHGVVPTVAAMVALADARPARPGREIAPFYLRDPDVNPNVKTRPVTTPAVGGPNG